MYLPDTGDDAQRSELEQRIAWFALQQAVRPAGVPEGAGVRVAFGRQSGWTPTTVSAAEVLEAARAAPPAESESER